MTLAPPSPEGLLSLATSTSTTITPNGQHINLELRYLLPSFKLFLPHSSSALTFITLVYHGYIHSLILPWHLVYLNTTSTPSTFSSTTTSHHVRLCLVLIFQYLQATSSYLPTPAITMSVFINTSLDVHVDFTSHQVPAAIA